MLSKPQWNMLALFGILIQLRTLTYKLLVRLLVVGVIHLFTVDPCKSSDNCLQELKWSFIQKCHSYFSICQLHVILHHKNLIFFPDHFQLSRNSTRSHPLNIRTASSSINSYRYSFLSTVFFMVCYISCHLAN